MQQIGTSNSCVLVRAGGVRLQRASHTRSRAGRRPVSLGVQRRSWCSCHQDQPGLLV